MKEQPQTKYTNEDIVSLIRDVIDIFSDSREELRSTDQEILKSIERLKATQSELKDDLMEEIRAARYESKMADDELRDELRSFKYEMKDFKL